MILLFISRLLRAPPRSEQGERAKQTFYCSLIIVALSDFGLIVVPLRILIPVHNVCHTSTGNRPS